MATEVPRLLRVLVVENHFDTLESLKLYIEDLGHTVFTSMTVQEALEVLGACPCDLVICDIGLPDGTGWDFMNRTREAHPRVFAVAMSGFGMNADSARSREAGFRRHLLKPFKATELDKVLAEAAEFASAP